MYISLGNLTTFDLPKLLPLAATLAITRPGELVKPDAAENFSQTIAVFAFVCEVQIK